MRDKMIKADNLLQESYLQMSINPAKNCKWPYRSIFSRNFIKLTIIFFFFWMVHSYFKIPELYHVQELHTEFYHVTNMTNVTLFIYIFENKVFYLFIFTSNSFYN